MRVELRLPPQHLLASLCAVTSDMTLPPPEVEWLPPLPDQEGLRSRAIAYRLRGLWGRALTLRHELVHRPSGQGECTFKHETLSLWDGEGRRLWSVSAPPSCASAPLHGWWSDLIRALSTR